MKKLLALLLSAALSMSVAIVPVNVNAAAVSQKPAYTNHEIAKAATYVYINKTGTTYHRASCKLLKKGCTKITLKSAKAKCYTPCSTCKPPKK